MSNVQIKYSCTTHDTSSIAKKTIKMLPLSIIKECIDAVAMIPFKVKRSPKTVNQLKGKFLLCLSMLIHYKSGDQLGFLRLESYIHVHVQTNNIHREKLPDTCGVSLLLQLKNPIIKIFSRRLKTASSTMSNTPVSVVLACSI